MSNYKHGDWYCKPANEAEAHEIVARALVSGAGLFDSIGYGVIPYPWNLFEGWGVRNNQTFAGSVHDTWAACRAKEYTIEQVREKFPLPSERQVNVGPHFEHEQKEVVRSDVNVSVGLPPVGTICDLIGCGITVEIIAHAENNTGMVAVFKYYDYNGVLSVDFKPASWFHPIKNEREQFVERVHDGYDGGAHHSTVMDIAGRIYDALKSGNLKAPEVDK